MKLTPVIRTDEAPRTFREVGIILQAIQDDIADLKQVQDDFIKSVKRNVVIFLTGLVFPIVVAGVTAYLFQN